MQIIILSRGHVTYISDSDEMYVLQLYIYIRIDCRSAKYVLEKDVQNIASKQIFTRWQAILSIFDFDIEYIKRSQNSIPNFLTSEFLQGKND
jgi:hypothetical protein